MSGITLRDYMSSARLDQSGAIRIARNDESQLVNKGTLGNRIASWFQKTFGELDPIRAKRQQDALDGFKDALAGTFGIEVAKLALAGIEDYGRTENPRLTGRMITAAVNHAKAISSGNQLANAGSVMTRRITQIIDAQASETQVEDDRGRGIGGVNAYANVHPNDAWRLVATGPEQNDRARDYMPSRDAFVTHHGIDNLVGLERAYGVMLDGHKNNVPLNAEHVLAINQAGPNPVSRQAPTKFVVDYGPWIFTERAEVERLQREDRWYAGGEIRETNGNAGPRYTVTLPGEKSPEDARRKLRSILDTYHTDIQRAETDSDKRLVIASAVQAMYRAQIFPEGERQSTVLAVMNRMLLDAGMSPCIFPDPSRIFGLRPSMVATLIAGGQSLFRHTFPPPIQNVDPPKIEITDLRIDDESSDDTRVTPPPELRFATIENRLVADARVVMSQKEWINAHQVYLRDLVEDANQPSDDIRYAQRQRKLEDREHTFTGNGQTIDLQKAEQVPTVIRNNLDLQDVVICDRDITAEHAADGLARFLDPGLFDRIYDTVVSKYAPDLLTKPPPIDFSIQKRQGDNDQPVYEITMRDPMPEGMPNDDPYDLVVTLEVDATASYLYDTGSSYCRLESRQ